MNRIPLLILYLCLAVPCAAKKGPRLCHTEFTEPAERAALMKALAIPGGKQEEQYSSLYNTLFESTVTSLRLRLKGSTAYGRAEDFVQEAFLTYWQMAPAKRPTYPGWFLLVAHRRAIEFLRLKENKPKVAIGNGGDDDEKEVDVADRAKPIAAAPAALSEKAQAFVGWRVARLPPQQRWAVELFLLGIPVERISQEMNLTPARVQEVYEAAVARLNAPLLACPMDALGSIERESALSVLTPDQRLVYVLRYRGETFSRMSKELGVPDATLRRRFLAAEKAVAPLLADSALRAQHYEIYIAKSLFAGVSGDQYRAVLEVWRKLSPVNQRLMLARWEGVTFKKIADRERRDVNSINHNFRNAMAAFAKALEVDADDLAFGPLPGIPEREQEMPLDLFAGLSPFQRVRLPAALSRLTPAQLHAVVRKREGITFPEIAREIKQTKGETLVTFAKAIDFLEQQLDTELVFAPFFRSIWRARDLAPILLKGLKARDVPKLQVILETLPPEQLDAVAWRFFGRSLSLFQRETGVSGGTLQERIEVGLTKIGQGLGIPRSKVVLAAPPIRGVNPATSLPNPFLDLTDAQIKKLQFVLASLSGQDLEVLEYYRRGFRYTRIGREIGVTNVIATRIFNNAMRKISAAIGKPVEELRFAIPTEDREKAAGLAALFFPRTANLTLEEVEQALETLRADQLHVLMMLKEGATFGEMGPTVSRTTARHRYMASIRKLSRLLGVPEDELDLRPAP